MEAATQTYAHTYLDRDNDKLIHLGHTERHAHARIHVQRQTYVQANVTQTYTNPHKDRRFVDRTTSGFNSQPRRWLSNGHMAPISQRRI